MKNGLKRFDSRAVWITLIALTILVGCLRVAATYSIFSQTWDEPAHVAAGLQWIDKGEYTLEPMHPPLARVMSALGMYMQGVRFNEAGADHPMWVSGNALLHAGGQYERNLSLARAGILPFFVIAALVAAAWARKMSGWAGAFLAVLLFTTLPPVLAHAGLATTDMAGAAFSAASFYFYSVWLKRATTANSIVFGVILGCAILSKFTTMYFLTLGFGLTALYAALDALHERRAGSVSSLGQWIKPSAITLLLCAVTIWGGYRFSAHSILNPANQPFEKVDQIVGAQGVLHDISYFALGRVPVPAPEFFYGIYSTLINNQAGRSAYLLGEVSGQGRWYFYPVVFLYKTPLPFFLLGLFGLSFLLREILRKNPDRTRLALLLAALLAIFLISMGSNMNLGVRQILGVYPLLAVAAGYGAFRLLNKSFSGAALVTLLVAWQLFASFGAQPDYLAYFNELAVDHPEEIAVDSDLDWGQDLKRLSQTLQRSGVDEIAIQYYGSQGIDLNLFNLPAWRELKPYQEESGWVVISISALKFGSSSAAEDGFAWLEAYEPVQRVGKSILLYYIP